MAPKLRRRPASAGSQAFSRHVRRKPAAAIGEPTASAPEAALPVVAIPITVADESPTLGDSTWCGPPLLLHVPHSSTFIPDDVLEDFVVPGPKIQSEQLRLVDWYTHELYMADDFPKEQRAVVAAVSRLVVDVERFTDDASEVAAKVGMGATYVKTTDGAELRRLAPERRMKLLAAHYVPHHARLDQLAKACIENHGRCVVLDCHSFPVDPLPTQTTNLDVSPQICIGTDEIHTSAELRDLVYEHFRSHKYEVLIDMPFRGTLVPNAFFSKDPRLQSVMVELRRDLYMHEKTGQRKIGDGSFAKLQAVLTELRGKLEQFAQEGSCSAWA